MLMIKHPAAKPSSEEGFASLVIAIVIVLVLSLITVGFAELMRHEERAALDKQLSSQAYYAAESGINDATKAINNGFKSSKTSCGPNASVPDLADNTVKFTDGSNPTNASYPCLLINPTPPNLHYDPIATTLSRTAEFTAIDSTDAPAAVTSIKISWQDSGSNQNFAPNCTSFKSTANWPYIGILRMQLVPIVSGSLDRANLTDNAFTAFLCPNSGSLSSTANYSGSIGPTNAGIIMYGNCSTSAVPLNCNATITGFPANQSTFFLNLQSLYSATAVTVTAYNGGTVLRLKGAQTLVDSTGKAQDVLRRVQVRVSSNNGYDIPDGSHADICKQFDLDPTSTASGAPSNSGCDTTSLTY
jgi:hypothetical protein